jgi:4-amino-4-deoxy-L-arabinose transferase-like glycosyltransferase
MRETLARAGAARHLLLLGVVIIAAALLRLYHLGEIPRGLFCDEAANGYDAYSLLKTGRDLHGTSLPLLLNHHDIDHIEALYSYLSIPLVAIFGLSVFSTRLLAALVGTLTVASSYLAMRELLGRHAGLVTAALLAVSPWHLLFSRNAFRAILVPLFIMVGLFLFLRALRKPPYLLACALVAGLSLHTYSTMKAFVPLAFLVLGLFYHREVLASLRSGRAAVAWAAAAILLFVVLAFPIYALSFFGEGNLRFEQISVFTTPSPALAFLRNMSRHLSPDFLFGQGDASTRRSLPNFGQVLLVLAPFAALSTGLAAFSLVNQQASEITRGKRRELVVLLCLLVVGAVPASLTSAKVPHALRAISALPFVETLAAAGIMLVCARARVWWGQAGANLAVLLVAALVALNAGVFLAAYFRGYPAISERVFQYGMEEAITLAEERAADYDYIFVTSSFNRAYIFPPFFTRADPARYQARGQAGTYLICEGDIRACWELPGRNLFLVESFQLSEHNAIATVRNSRGEVTQRLIEGEGTSAPSQPAPPLAWLNGGGWNAPEHTTDTRRRPFRWLRGEHGELTLYSEYTVVARLSFAVLASVGEGDVSLWQGQSRLLNLPVAPRPAADDHRQQRVVWLLLRPGLTRLDIRTTVAPQRDEATNRWLTLAVARPEMVLFSPNLKKEKLENGEGGQSRLWLPAAAADSVRPVPGGE